jgi:two-component system nitrate/nitrite response regulator NarL
MNEEHPQTTIAVASHEPIWSYGIRCLVEAEADMKVVAEANNAGEALASVAQFRPDLLLLDFEMPPSGQAVLAQLSDHEAGARTLLLACSLEEEQIAEAFQAGARGFVLKGSDTRVILDGVRALIAGQYWVGDRLTSEPGIAFRDFAPPSPQRQSSWRDYHLTPREIEIVAAIANGCSNSDASEKLSIALRTVKHHLSNIYEKLGLSSRLELAMFAMNNRRNSDTFDPKYADDRAGRYAKAS